MAVRVKKKTWHFRWYLRSFNWLTGNVLTPHMLGTSRRDCLGEQINILYEMDDRHEGVSLANSLFRNGYLQSLHRLSFISSIFSVYFSAFGQVCSHLRNHVGSQKPCLLFGYCALEALFALVCVKCNRLVLMCISHRPLLSWNSFIKLNYVILCSQAVGSPVLWTSIFLGRR